MDVLLKVYILGSVTNRHSAHGCLIRNLDALTEARRRSSEVVRDDEKGTTLLVPLKRKETTKRGGYHPPRLVSFVMVYGWLWLWLS